MTSRKFFPAAILSLAVLFTACSASGTEVSETVSETISETVTTAAETTSAASETTAVTAETAAEAEEKAASSIADNIKEALRSVWNDDIYFVQIYAEDLNDDGVKELLVNYSYRSSDERGTTYVFDVSGGADKLYEISANTAVGDMYADESGNLHYIIRESFYNYIKTNANYTLMKHNYIYFDISHDSIIMPFYGDKSAGDEQVKVYKNCEVMPTNAKTHTNFSEYKAEFFGKVSEDELNAAWSGEESNEASQIIQEAVFDGLTYVSEPKGIYFGRNFEDFEGLWQDAELRIGQAYGYESIPDTSGVDYIKEALQAEWDKSVSVISLYTADLNSDGVKELFVNYSFGAAQEGVVYVYDVSDGVKKLYEISARIWAGDAKLYKDENETVHFILQANYGGSVWQCNHAYFDITHDSIKMPFYVDIQGWFDNGAHIFDDNIYKNCEVVPYEEEFGGWRNFDREKAEFIGKYDAIDIRKALEEGESNEVSEIIQKEVFEGLTYVSDVEELYGDSGYTAGYATAWDFEYFWQEAAPKLAEIYG